MPHRAVKDLDLAEVSILDRTKSPAYEGTLITARTEDGEVTDQYMMHYRGEDFIDEVEVKEEEQPEETEDAKSVENASNEREDAEVQEAPTEAKPKQQEEEVVKNIDNQEIDYSKYENMLKEMKEEK